MRSVWAFVRLSRPHFLLGGFLMFALGAAATDRFDVRSYVMGQAMITAAQVTAHFVNEWADVEADRAVVHRTLFSGGSGVLVEGLLSESVAVRAAWVGTAVAVAAAGALAMSSLPAALLGIAALGVSWSYSTPPLRLLSTGWGEAAVSLVVAVIVPLVGVYAQGGVPVEALWWSVATLFPIHFAMMLAFELPDLDSDRLAGKRVLAVRIGRQRAVALITLLLAGALVTSLLARAIDSWPAPAWGGFAGIPPALVMLIAIRRKRSIAITASAVATLVFAASGLLIGMTR